jgi:hypothetical protein
MELAVTFERAAVIAGDPQALWQLEPLGEQPVQRLVLVADVLEAHHGGHRIADLGQVDAGVVAGKTPLDSVNTCG